MTICSSITCLECGKIYNDSTRRTCIGKCRHSICLHCKNALNLPNCPICDEVGAFQETVINHQTVNFLADFQKCLSEADIELATKELQNLGHGPCSKCNSESRKLRICTDCTSLVVPGLAGTWTSAYLEKGIDIELKVKSVAICANCAIDYHEEHKVINLTIIDSLKDGVERKSLNTMMSLIEKSMQMALGSGKMEMVVYMFKNIALRYKVNERLSQLDYNEMDWSDYLVPENREQIVLLKESIAGIRKLQKRKEELDKMTLMKQRAELVKATMIYSFFKLPTEKNRKVVAELVEIYESLPTDLLSMDDYGFFELEVEQEMTRLIFAKRMRGFLTIDDDRMNCEVIKEQYKKVFREIDIQTVARNRAHQEIQKPFFEKLKTADVMIRSVRCGEPVPPVIEVHIGKYVNIDEETINLQLRSDELNRKWLQAMIHERFVGLMLLVSFPMITDSQKKMNFINEINEVVDGYDDVFQKMRK